MLVLRRLAFWRLRCGELKFTAIAAVKFRIYAAGWIRF